MHFFKLTIIEFIRWFHESSVTANLQIFQKTEFGFFILLLMWTTRFIFLEKIRRFVVTEFVKLSDEFDRYKKRCIKGQNLGVDQGVYREGTRWAL